MTTARAKYVEDLYLEALAAAVAVAVTGGTSCRPCLDVAEKLRQLHISLITEENDKAKMPNMKLDGEQLAAKNGAYGKEKDPLRDISSEEFNAFCNYAETCVSPIREALYKLIESRRHD
jgi:hypothetical protein